MTERLFTFVGGAAGPWRIDALRPVVGETLPDAARLTIAAGQVDSENGSGWRLRGVTSNERYVTRAEKASLVAVQPSLARPEATRAALVPIRKSPEWWALSQEERRTVFEEQSAHVRSGLRYLPAVARRLHHCRDLGVDEPFDFVTWFEYAPADAGAFEEIVGLLRASPEWRFVTREVDVRLSR
jgi:hypothetical protein